MAQVLHMDTSFPGKSNPTSPTAIHGKDQDLPYSVETPYGYRLDLDFLKYVNDIEKGNTIKKVPIHRRPRYNSLPRGYGYTGSWWTSTESLCSNASVDSRHSSYSYCAPGYYGSHRPEPGRSSLGTGGFNFNARVERTLLDARKKLEEDQKDGRRFSNLGSLHSSIAGSTSSLASQGYSRAQNGAQGAGGGGQFTPMSSGLSTPVSPTPAHLQHVREQMAVALRKIRELEEQVKMIPVLQVKISVLQEEKRQLSVQLKSQKFLGHTMGFGKGRSRGELYIDIPEEDSTGPVAAAARGGPLSPTTPEGSRQDSGCEIEDTVIVGGARQPAGGRKEVRSIGTEPEAGAKREVRHIGVEVREQDLGVQSESEAWKTKASLLETQLRKTLQELHTAHRKLEALGKETAEKGQDAKPSMADAVMMTSIGWQELQQWGRPGEPSPLQTVVTFSQHPPCREQRTVGIQVYTLEQPTVVGVRSFQETTTTPRKDQAEFVQQPSWGEGGGTHAELTGLVTKDPNGQQGGTEAELTVTHRREEPQETSFPVHSSNQLQKKSVEGPVSVPDSAPELPIAICSKEVREVLQKSEVSSSVPVCSPAVVMETVSATQLVSNQLAPLCQRLKEGDMTQQTPHETAPAQEDNSSQPASPQSSLKSIMKRKDSEACTDSPNTKKNLQFIGVNGGYESTSSDSSSESSDSSSESEYHEANERLPPTQDAPRAHSEEAAPGPLQEATATAFPPAPSEGAAAEQDRSTAQETQPEDSTRLELSDTLMSACTVLQKALGETNAFSQQEARTAYTTVLQEWLRVSCHKAADAEVVRRYMVAFQAISPQLLEFIINMADGNGNTTLHYTVSHSNFPVVKLLLDTGLCNADKQNKAGYTAIMLTALAAFHSSSDLETVTQLLRTGDVNAKASQAGQTALMLAVSHGRSDMVGALLACGANVNLQDDDGSTALMCACEHGHVDIVKQLLAVPGCDATLTDNDGSTALSIAMEANQNDIAVLLYAHLNFAKPPSPVTQKAVLFGTVTPPGETK
ncbi:KN motif and ankyrin repeat domain-containing protein 2 [Lepisosteus oculatus]|uniref:KN motif and ankyrin repeat domain-containing protein 2 n=1 Tax=Lepisosteus oculatus TaxID=7918 RepID=UPI0035F5190D